MGRKKGVQSREGLLPSDKNRLQVIERKKGAILGYVLREERVGGGEGIREV